MPEHQKMQQSGKPDSTFQKQAALTTQTQVSHPASIIQRARINPKSLTAADVLQLQRTIGNRAVGRLLSEIRNPSKVQQVPIQRQPIPEEEKETLQGMFGKKPEETCPSCVQRQEKPEEEEPLQGKFETIQRLEPEEKEKLQMKSVVQRQETPEDEEPLQDKMAEPVQRQEIPEEEELIQGKMIGTVQRQEIPEEEEPLQKKSENNTGMPDNLKAGVESLSGIDMSDVRVHYNSNKPAEVGALAYTQGTNIHVSPGQERHLPHEAWHVVQQAQGRVQPTMQMKKGMNINDDVCLEDEATKMGNKAVQMYAQMEILKENKGMEAVNSVFQEKSVKQGFHFSDNLNEATLQKNYQPFDYNLSTGQLIQANESKNGISGREYINPICTGEQKIKGLIEAVPSHHRITTTPSSAKEIIQRKTINELNQKAQRKDEIGIGNFNYTTLTVGATHTGEMYHLKAAKSLFPLLNTLIWGVRIIDNHKTVNKAFDIGDYINSQDRTYYTARSKPDEPKPTTGELSLVRSPEIQWIKFLDEGLATSLIMFGIQNSGDRNGAKDTIKGGIAPQGDVQKKTQYRTDLDRYHFVPNSPYVLVNFRSSGHTEEGTAPALDTGIEGYNQIIDFVRTNLPGVTIVPMGEQEPRNFDHNRPNLIRYWNWHCCVGRAAQAGLLRYLKENYNIRGAVGMRSGIMDMMAFAGIDILSIDISPSKMDGTSKGWERGAKLESALGTRYGRTFIQYPRGQETQKPIANWRGQFDARDLRTIGASVRNYFTPGQQAPLKDVSHPLSPTALQALIQGYQGRQLQQPDITYLQSILNQLKASYNATINKQSFIAQIKALLR